MKGASSSRTSTASPLRAPLDGGCERGLDRLRERAHSGPGGAAAATGPARAGAARRGAPGALTGWRIARGATAGLPDVEAFLETLQRIGGHRQPEVRELFDLEGELVVTRAPGRLDVMGGIADYSGSLVLQLPLREATRVALQKDRERRLRVVSRGGEAVGRDPSFEIALAELEGLPYEAARERFRSEPRRRWAAYVAGVFLVLGRERGVRFPSGRPHPRGLRRARGQWRQLLGRARGRGDAGRGRCLRPLPPAARARAAVPAGRERGGGGALRRDGPDDGRLRGRRPPARPAVPARGVARGRSPCPGTWPSGESIPGPPRGFRLRLHGRARRAPSWAPGSWRTGRASPRARRGRGASVSRTRAGGVTSPT